MIKIMWNKFLDKFEKDYIGDKNDLVNDIKYLRENPVLAVDYKIENSKIILESRRILYVWCANNRKYIKYDLDLIFIRMLFHTYSIYFDNGYLLEDLGKIMNICKKYNIELNRKEGK